LSAQIGQGEARERKTMTIRTNAALRRRLASAALGGLIAFAAVPAAMAQWLPPWRAVAPAGAIAERLQEQGYVLVAPLQRRPGVYLADVRVGPGGFQRLVIDDRSGEILERFISPPRNFGPEYAVRYNEFAAPPPAGVVQPPYGPGFSIAPNGGPTTARIPSAISPFGSQLAPDTTKPKPKSAATDRKTPSAKTSPAAAPPTVTPPLPPPAPREAAKPDPSAPPAPEPQPKIESPPGEIDNASTTSAPAAPESEPEPAKIEPQTEARTQPTATTPVQSPASAVGPAPAPEAGDKSKVSIVPAALFE
jgi:hypothetical protein